MRAKRAMNNENEHRVSLNKNNNTNKNNNNNSIRRQEWSKPWTMLMNIA